MLESDCIMKKCPKCQYPNPDSLAHCHQCKADLAPPEVPGPEPEATIQPSIAKSQPRAKTRPGDILIAAGIVIGSYFLAIYDTSVSVPGGAVLGIDRVNNLGLMQNREIGIIVAVLIIAIGVAMRIAEGFKQNEQDNRHMQSEAQPSLAAKVAGAIALVVFTLICIKALMDEIHDYRTDPATSGGQSQKWP